MLPFRLLGHRDVKSPERIRFITHNFLLGNSAMKFRSDAYVFRFGSMTIHLASSCFGPVWIGLDTYLRLPKAAADRTASAQCKAEEMACPEAKPIPASTVQIPWFEGSASRLSHREPRGSGRV